MNAANERSYDALERVFHEPSRLKIMSALCAAGQGLPFTALKTECDLTDGNLNRHLKVLEESGAVSVRKAFVGGKPRTTVSLSRSGARRFAEYLEALQEVLDSARRRLPVARASAAAAAGANAPATA